jgi:cytochrome c biogenesis protein CcmG, thiol:disulfide interchange protein DsbE
MLKRLLQTLLFALVCSSPAVFADELNLAAYKGKVVYIDFWASWCGPCRQSFPWMKGLHNAKAKDGLVIIAVNVDQDQKLANAFIDEFLPDFKIIFDPAGALASEFKVAGMPSAYIIDREGKPRFKHIGYHADKREQYEQEIQTLLNEK